MQTISDVTRERKNHSAFLQAGNAPNAAMGKSSATKFAKNYNGSLRPKNLKEALIDGNSASYMPNAIGESGKA